MPDRSKNDANDLTAFLASQRTWGPGSGQQPQVNFLWEVPVPRNAPAYNIGTMMYQGRQVLDLKDNTIKAFRNLPDTISSKVEGWRVVAWMREDHRITYADIEARVRTHLRQGRRVPVNSIRDIQGRMTRFRDQFGLISWTSRNDAISRQKKAFLHSLRNDHQRNNNLSVGRMLTMQERNRLRQIGLDSRDNAVTGETNAGYRDNINRKAGQSGSASPGTQQQPTNDAEGESSPEETSEVEEEEATDVADDNDEEEDGEGEVEEHRDEGASSDGNGDPNDEESEEESSADDGKVKNEPDNDAEESDSENLPDSRDEVPRNPDARNHVRQALFETLKRFRELTNGEPPRNNPRESYNTQWEALQQQLNDHWQRHRPGQVTPTLVKRTRWVRGLDEYNNSGFEGKMPSYM